MEALEKENWSDGANESHLSGGAATTPTLASVSVDVEDYFHVESLKPYCPREKWHEYESRVEKNTDRILALLDKLGGKGTFFILGCVAEKYPELIKRIAAADHEIASHGYDHDLVYNLTPDEFRTDVRRTKALLEDLSGKPVIGYRAPSYTIMSRTLWALPVLAEEGYLYDSSVFPIPRRRYGMPKANRWPSRIEFENRSSIVEFPLPTVKFGPINVPATGGAYLRLLPLGFQKWALGALRRQGRPYVVNIHPWEIDSDQPRFAVKMRTRWTHYHNLDNTERRLAALLSTGGFQSQADLLRSIGLL